MAKSLRKRFAVMAAVLIAALALPVIGSGTVHAAGGTFSVWNAFNEYGQPRNSIKGDILIKKTGDTTYDSEDQAVYQMKDGQDYTLGLKLNTTGIKEDMENIKKASGFTGTDPLTASGDATLDVVGIVNPESQMTADVKIPEGIDMSKVDLNKHKLQLGDNFGEYKVNESLKLVPIDNTDPYKKDKGYDLSDYRFQVTSAAYDEASRNLHIVMTLQIPKNYYGKSYDDVSQFNFGCLYKIVNGMPDNFTLEIPGIALDKNVKEGQTMTFDGSMGQNSNDSDCYMSARVSYTWRLPFRGNWYASQLAGGADAANPKESAQGISLTVQKEVPKPVQPDNPKPTQPTKTDSKPAANNTQTVQKTSKVNTGDTTPIALYVILAAAAAGVAVVLIKHRPARH
jgi:hypothetical protein